MNGVEARTIQIAGQEIQIHGHPEDFYFHSVCIVPDYDVHLAALTARCLETDAVLLDVGANIGYFAMSVAAICRASGAAPLIYSFEPATVNIEPFLLTLEANPELGAGIRLMPYGLSSTGGNAKLTYTRSNTASAHITTDPDGVYPESQQVELRTLQSFLALNEVDRIDFIKVDIEGHERDLLSGIEDVIRDHEPALLIEVNAWVIDVMARSSTSTFVDYLCSLAPYAFGIGADGTYIDVKAERMDYLRANLLARTHQDVYLDFNAERVGRALRGLVPYGS